MNTITAFATDVVAHDHWHHDGDWFPWFPLVPLLILGIGVTLAVVLSRRARTSPSRSAEAVLTDRFARGEIDEAELDERRAVLRRKS